MDSKQRLKNYMKENFVAINNNQQLPPTRMPMRRMEIFSSGINQLPITRMMISSSSPSLPPVTMMVPSSSPPIHMTGGHQQSSCGHQPNEIVGFISNSQLIGAPISIPFSSQLPCNQKQNCQRT